MGVWRVAAAVVVASFVATSFVATSFVATSVRAQDVDAQRDRRARQHFLSASAYFETGDYESALREFQAAHRESERPEILYNVYLCEERLGNLGAAIAALERFLAEAEVENRSALEQRLARLRARRASGETRIDRGDVSDARPIDPDAAGSTGGDPNAGERSVRDGGAAGGGAPVLAIAGFSVAALGLVGLAVGGVITLSEDARLRDECAPACDDDEVSTIAASRWITDVSGGVALLGAVVGLIGLLTHDGGGDTAESGAVSARVGPGAVGIEGRF